MQVRNEVRWRPGQELSLAPPVFEPEVFWNQIYRIEESIVKLLIFGPLCSHSAPP